MSKKKKKSLLTFIESYLKVRKSWGSMNPVTKVVPNKKKKSRAKIKRDFRRDNNEF